MLAIALCLVHTDLPDGNTVRRALAEVCTVQVLLVNYMCFVAQWFISCSYFVFVVVY